MPYLFIRFYIAKMINRYLNDVKWNMMIQPCVEYHAAQKRFISLKFSPMFFFKCLDSDRVQTNLERCDVHGDVSLQQSK